MSVLLLKVLSVLLIYYVVFSLIEYHNVKSVLSKSNIGDSVLEIVENKFLREDYEKSSQYYYRTPAPVNNLWIVTTDGSGLITDIDLAENKY